jgi:putative oxidoreductase
MSTNISTAELAAELAAGGHARAVDDANNLSRYLVPVARAAFAAIFILSFLGHFSSQSIAYAAAAGVPLAGLLVPLSGLLELAGGLSVLLGYRARIGAWLLVLFLVPVTLAMHHFWTIADPGARQLDMVMFLKNLSMLGGALFIAHAGAGSISLDARAGRR